MSSVDLMDLGEGDMTNLKAQDREDLVLTPSAQKDTGHVLTDRIQMDSLQVDGALSHEDQQDNFIQQMHHMDTVPDLAVHGGWGPGLIWDSNNSSSSSRHRQTHSQKAKNLLQTQLAISSL